MVKAGAPLVALLCLVSCQSADTRPIPLANRAPWRQVFRADSTFRIAMDTTHVKPGPAGTWFVWFVTTHAAPLGPDSLRFDRGRIRLLLRCDPLAFKSVSQDLGLGDARPVSHREWPLDGPNAVGWQSPKPGATDDQFIRAACAVLEERFTPRRSRAIR